MLPLNSNIVLYVTKHCRTNKVFEIFCKFKFNRFLFFETLFVKNNKSRLYLLLAIFFFFFLILRTNRKVYIFDSDKFYIFQKKIHLKIFRYTLKGYNNRLETRRILRRKRGKFIQRVSSFQRDRSIRGGGGIERGRRSP